MPRRKRSERGRAVAPPRSIPAPATAPGNEARHLRCPVCGLMARPERIALGPYPVQARTERWGGSLRSPDGQIRNRPGIIIWSDPEAPEPAEADLVARKVLEAQSPVTAMPQIARSKPSTPVRIPPRQREAPSRPSKKGPQAGPTVPAGRFTLGTTPSARNIELLVEHLETLKDLPAREPSLIKEAQRLAPGVEDWLDPLNALLDSEEAKDAPSETKLDTLNARIAAVEGAVEALGNNNLQEAIDMLEGGL